MGIAKGTILDAQSEMPLIGATIQMDALDEQAFSERYDPYFRWDVKLGFQLNNRKRKMAHRFCIDLQNVLNTENVFVRRYNRQPMKLIKLVSFQISCTPFNHRCKLELKGLEHPELIVARTRTKAFKSWMDT